MAFFWTAVVSLVGGFACGYAFRGWTHKQLHSLGKIETDLKRKF